MKTHHITAQQSSKQLSTNGPFDPNSLIPDEETITAVDKDGTTFKREIRWIRVFFCVFIHVAALVGLILCAEAKYATLIFGKYIVVVHW